VKPVAPRIAFFALLAAVGGLTPLLAAAASTSWWNSDWKYRKEVDFDLSPTGADVAGSTQDVPILARLSLGNFNYFNDMKSDGSDLRAIDADDKTPLKFHIERFDAQNQLAFIWIDVPRLTGGVKTDKIFLYYGNANAQAAGDPARTFDANQALMLEFNQASGLPQDVTAYKNNPSTSTAQVVPASLIAGGAKFSGTQLISVPASPSLRLIPAQGWTAGAWAKAAGPQQQAYLLSQSDNGREIALGIDGTHAFARYSDGGTPVTVTQTGSELSSSDWHYLAVTAGSGQLTLYVDGVSAGQVPVSLQEIGGTFTVGGSARSGNYFNGEVDEVGVSKTVRGPDWIKAIARSEGTTSPLVAYGEDGQKDSGGQGSYFLTIARNLTADGWVVIVICITMLVIALAIMVLKAIYLGSVERANGRFLNDYHHLGATDAAALDQKSQGGDQEAFEEQSPILASLSGHEGKYGSSTLYRLYHLGVAELDKRIAGKAAGAQRATVLSAQSIEAIRAAMDATLTRLQQRLSAQMVLLTIAISGGPFLGLLGTVVGVMITFAAIAASGDVNINAIAPGTAAALAATVAGLSVAIPSLFGYNWLNTRIKAISANNRVFLDEFVARLAEQYS
jgi:biopolymer transport protein ExbB